MQRAEIQAASYVFRWMSRDGQAEMSTIEHQKFTAEDLLTMPEGDRYELVDGELRELHMSQESSWIAGEIFGYLRAFVKEHELGWVFPEGTAYQCFPWDPQMVRKPDTSFIARDRLPEGPVGQGHTRIAPDLVVEVVSTHDNVNELESKLADYLEAGVKTIWVMHPSQRLVVIHRHDEPSRMQRLKETDEIRGDGPLEGFSCCIRDFFPATTEADKS
jgi:Uma2 family endonuclease